MSFKQSNEQSVRRLVRDAIRNSELTRSQKDVTLAVTNLWFHHRTGYEKVVRAGQRKIAKRAKVTTQTVYRTLCRLEAAGILIAVKNPKGGSGPTHYKMDLHALMTFCGCDWVDEFLTGAFKYNLTKGTPQRPSPKPANTPDEPRHLSRLEEDNFGPEMVSKMPPDPRHDPRHFGPNDPRQNVGRYKRYVPSSFTVPRRNFSRGG